MLFITAAGDLLRGEVASLQIAASHTQQDNGGNAARLAHTSRDNYHTTY